MAEVTRDEFWANTHMRKTEVQNPEEGKFFLPHGDDKDAQGFMKLVDSITIPRFCVEQRLRAMSTINFCAKTKATKGWTEWCLEILKDPKYESTLKMAGVFDAITVAGKLDVNVCKKALTLLLSRWSSSTHTFIAAWGEFTPTLEDVITLLRLNVLATDNIMDIKLSKLSKEEREINKFLKESITTSGKNKSRFSVRGGHSRGTHANFCAWIRYFYQEVGPSSKNNAGEVILGPEAGSPYVLEAFIAMWLSKFIFPGPPSEGVSAHVFPLAIKIAKGKCFSLATVYLATLYRRLDMVAEEAMRGSKGSNAHACYVDTGFLQMFLWERFPFYAPKRAGYLTNRLIPRARCWSDVYPLKNFQANLDMEDRVSYRPYSTIPAGVDPVKAFAYEGRKINLNQQKQISDDAFIALIMLLPYSFISLVEEGNDNNFSPMLYCPERVARQFGLDQGIASIQYADMNTVEASKPLILEHYCDIYKTIGVISIPSSTRQGVVTPGWFKAWRNVLKTFQEFIWEKVPKPPIVQSLTQPNKGKEVASSNVEQWRPSNVATNQDDTVEVDQLLLSVKRKREAPTAARNASMGVRSSPYREALGEIGQENEISPAVSTENDGPWTPKDDMAGDNWDHLLMQLQNVNTVEVERPLVNPHQGELLPKDGMAGDNLGHLHMRPQNANTVEVERPLENPHPRELLPSDHAPNEHSSSEIPSNESLCEEAQRDSSDSEGDRSNSESKKTQVTRRVMWRDIPVRAHVIPTLERICNKREDCIAELSYFNSATLRTCVAECLAKCVNLCERHSAHSLPRSDRDFIVNFVDDMELWNVSWLRDEVMGAIMYGMMSDKILVAEALRKEVVDTKAKLGKLEEWLATVEKKIGKHRLLIDVEERFNPDNPILTITSPVCLFAGDPQARAGETEHQGAGNTTCGIAPATQYPMIHSPCERVMWRDIHVRADVIPALERISHEMGYCIGNDVLSSFKSATLRTYVAECLATCVNLCVRHSARSLPRSDREFIHNFIEDMGYRNIRVLSSLRFKVWEAIEYGMISDEILAAEAPRKEVENVRAKLGILEERLATAEERIKFYRRQLNYFDGFDPDSPILTIFSPSLDEKKKKPKCTCDRVDVMSH